MIKRTLFPIIKKKIVLFLSLIFITTIGVMFSTGFISCFMDYKRESLNYINNYGLPDILLTTSEFLDVEVSTISIDGAEIFYRYVGNADFIRQDKVYKTRVTTFDSNSFSKRYVVSKTNDSLDKTNINVDFVFANNNSFKVGEDVTIHLNNVTKNLFINKIVGNPESVSPSTGTSAPVDKYNFGYTYIDKKEMSDFNIKNNQAIIKITDNSKNKETIYNDAKSKLESKGIKVTSKTYKEDNPSYKSIISTTEDMKKAAITVPVVCISILLVLVFLFMYQVSKSLTHEFGIMLALGNSIKSVLGLLIGFATVVSLISSALGIVCGHLLSSIIYKVFKYSFAVPCGYGGVLLNVSLFSILAALLVTSLAAILTIVVIARINPKEVINNSKDTYKSLPKPIEKLVDKTGISSKIAIASILKEKVRSIVSIFAIIASFSICFGSINLYHSQTGLINQLYDRNNFEAEVYIQDNNKINDVISFVEEKKKEGLVKEYENVKTAYLKFNNKGDSYTISGIKDSSMHNIVDNNNKRISFDKENTIVIDELYARENNYKIGDVVKINDIDITIQDIAHNCSYKRNYMSYSTLDRIIKAKSGTGYLETIAINTNNLVAFTRVITLANLNVYVVNIDTLMKTMCSGHEAIVLLTKALVALGVILGLATLTVMAVTSINEQKRKFSIMQSLGLKLKEVSRVIAIQNTTYILIGFLIGIPVSYFFGKWMVDVCTTRHNALFNFNYWWTYFLVAGFIILISLITHVISIINIKHTNLVANTCSRE